MGNAETESNRTQIIAIGLIIMACVALGIGEWKNWIHLVDFANTFGGGGVGILTGQKLSQATKTGDIVNPPAEPQS